MDCRHDDTGAARKVTLPDNVMVEFRVFGTRIPHLAVKPLDVFALDSPARIACQILEATFHLAGVHRRTPIFRTGPGHQ